MYLDANQITVSQILVVISGPFAGCHGFSLEGFRPHIQMSQGTIARVLAGLTLRPRKTALEFSTSVYPSSKAWAFVRLIP